MTATGHPLGTPEDVIARLVHARITAGLTQAASTAAHQAAELRTAAIEACGLCDADGYLPTRVVCDHVDRVDTNARGMAACRAALTKPDPETETETVEASR